MDRRAFLGLGAGALTTALAGCGASSGESTATEAETTATPTGTPTDDDTATPEPTGTETATPEETGYSVSMAPVGDVAFEEVPEEYVVYTPGYADMGVALGQSGGLQAVGYTVRYHTDHYAELEGIGVEEGELTQLLGDSFQIDKELFYDLDADVHLIDPEWLVNNGFFKLDRDDVEEVRENVAPFVGNTIFRRTDDWHDYRYYTMYEAFGKVAQVFRKEPQYEAFKSFHDEVVADVQSRLPGPDSRPAALLCFAGEDQPEEFSPYRLSGKGTNKKQFHDLGIGDALANTGIEGLSTTERGTIDYETLLEVDPDALLVRGHEDKTEEEFRETVVSYMADHDVAGELTAVRNGTVFRGGPIYQGPIAHLFNLERFATALFPETFSGDLFARAELSAIVRGEF